MVTSTGTSQLPSRGGRGRGCDWTRPGGYSYRYCSASSVWHGGGGVDWTTQRCVFTVELFRDCSPVQQPDKSTFPRTFPNFPITLPIFPRTIPRLDCSTSGQEQRDVFTI